MTLCDLVKSDLALLDPYLASCWQWSFTSISPAVFPSASSTYCQPLLPSPFYSALLRLFKSTRLCFPSQSFSVASASPALVEGKSTYMRSAGDKEMATVCLSCILLPFPIHICYTYAYMESSSSRRVSWRGDGWLEPSCLPQRRAEIHNLWRKNPALALLGKSCKS